MPMPQLMDVLFDIKHKKIEDSDKIMKNHECKLRHDCNIVNNVVQTREQRRDMRHQRELSRSRNRKHSRFHSSGLLQSQFKHYSKIELLDLIHIRLFHQEQTDRRLLSDTDDILTAQLKFETVILFKDSLNNHKLGWVKQFCDEENYDSEAIYDDLHPDNDGQSNIYRYFKNMLGSKPKAYYKLKKDIYKYTIYPPDNKAIERNLIELDFGEHIINWNVEAKFYNIKEEWLHNDFFPLGSDIYDSLCEKAEWIAQTKKNKQSYNLDTYDMLCIKTYTDTNELQSNFRHAFRTTADVNRRSQFVHWATTFQTVYIKIEMANRLHNSHQFISNVTLYHGLNRLFDTKQLMRQFYGLLSTTWEESVAKNFAGGAGMILQISQEINNKNVNAIEVDWISCHETEKE
eukprot:305164_1